MREFPPVEENIETPSTLSQSLLAKHDNCPRSAYLARRVKRASIEMDRGIVFHDAVEKAQKHALEYEETLIPPEMVRDLAEVAMTDHPNLVLPTREQDAIRAMAWNWGESSHATVDPETLVGVEISLELELGGYVCTCRLDRVEAAPSTLYVYDWKTGWPGRREDVLRSFQGQFYGMALLFGVRSDTGLSLGAGVNDVWFYEVFPRRKDEVTGQPITLEAAWTRTELAEFRNSLERNIERFAESLETGDWPARDGSWCSECPAPTECPIPAHLRSVKQITSASEAADAFSHKMALERESRRLQSGLRGWVQETEQPIYVGDYAFDATVIQGNEVKDWDEFLTAVMQTVDYGAPLDVTAHIRPKRSTKVGKRRKTEEEINA